MSLTLIVSRRLIQIEVNVKLSPERNSERERRMKHENGRACYMSFVFFYIYLNNPKRKLSTAHISSVEWWGRNEACFFVFIFSSLIDNRGVIKIIVLIDISFQSLSLSSKITLEYNGLSFSQFHYSSSTSIPSAFA